MASPDEKIQILKSTQTCFVCGMLSLIPILGAGFAISALRARHVARRTDRDAWNPGRRYLRWGTVLAWIGGVITLVILGFVAYQVGEVWS